MTPPVSPMAITGVGAITTAGTGLQPLLEALHEGRTCLCPVPAELSDGHLGLLWGRAERFKVADFIPPLRARKLDRGSQFAVAAAGLALAEAGLVADALSPQRIGIALGCGFGGIANSVDFLSGYFEQGAVGLSPLLFPNTVANAPASNTSIAYNLQGPNITFVQRFCSAESALLAACRFLEEGRADVMLTGGVDELTPEMMQGFAALGQLQTHAAGFGEGSGILVLERPDHAKARGARIRGHIRRIATLGLLLAGAEQQGRDRLLPQRRSFTQVTVSGAEPFVEPLLRGVSATTLHRPGRIFGRSLAMGGVVMGMLSRLLSPGEEGLHLAASPEGPCFAITLEGGDPA